MQRAAEVNRLSVEADVRIVASGGGGNGYFPKSEVAFNLVSEFPVWPDEFEYKGIELRFLRRPGLRFDDRGLPLDRAFVLRDLAGRALGDLRYATRQPESFSWRVESDLVCDRPFTYVGLSAERFEFTLETLDQSDRGWGVERKSVHCESCNAAYSSGGGELSTTCPFCGSNRVVSHIALHDFIRPGYLIPFTVDDDRSKLLAK